MTITAKFAGRCATCGGRIPAGAPVNWDKATRKVAHADAALCAQQQARPAQPPATVHAKPIADFLLAAKARGLKWPSVRFLAPEGQGRTLRLSVAGPLSKAPGSVQVKVDDNWIGRVEPSGAVVGPLAENRAVLDALARIATDPAPAAKAYGMVMGCCSFCEKPLTDAGSIEVGYGPVCAKRYGLPHRPQGTPNREQFETAAREPARDVVEASDIREELGIGFPQDFRYDGDSFHLLSVDRDGENDILAVHYVGTGGRRLAVLND